MMRRNQATQEEVKQNPWKRKFDKNWQPYLSEVSRQKRRVRRLLDQNIVKYNVPRLFDIQMQLPKKDAESIEDRSKKQKDFIDPTTDAELKVIDD